MNPDVIYSIILVVLLLVVVFLSLRYGMLKDNNADPASPYSWSRVQLAWWTIIILSSFVAILFTYNDAPTLTTSTVVLLGISSATTAAAKMIQVADQGAPAPPIPPPPQVTEGFFLDILSDKRSVSIPRFQTVVFNLAFGIWFIVVVFEKLHTLPDDDINAIMPDFAPTNLVLLGLSSATYAALKMTEK